jgi:hypothetical protein
VVLAASLIVARETQETPEGRAFSHLLRSSGARFGRFGGSDRHKARLEGQGHSATCEWQRREDGIGRRQAGGQPAERRQRQGVAWRLRLLPPWTGAGQGMMSR